METRRTRLRLRVSPGAASTGFVGRVVDRYAGQFPEIVAREINAAAEASAVLRRYGG